MPNDDEALKRHYREFMELMPLTLALAGLRSSEGQLSYTPEQLENRAQIVINAFRVARETVRASISSV